MGKFSSGKHAYFISDRSGQRYRYKDARREWTGAIVGPDEYEPKHPQLFPVRNVVDVQALRDARPDRTEPAVQQLLRKDAFASGSSGSSVITVTEINHGRTTADTVRFRRFTALMAFLRRTWQTVPGIQLPLLTRTHTHSPRDPKRQPRVINAGAVKMRPSGR